VWQQLLGQNQLPCCESENPVDIYNPEKEILLFDDGIKLRSKQPSKTKEGLGARAKILSKSKTPAVKLIGI